MTGGQDRTGRRTSTSTILAQTIFADGVRNVAAGASVIDLKCGLDRAAKVAIEALARCRVRSKRARQRAQVGTISANNDPAIGGTRFRIDGEGRWRGCDHRRGIEDHLDDAGGGRGPVRPWLHLTLFRHQSREDRGELEGHMSSSTERSGSRRNASWTCHPTPHVGCASRQPDLYAGWRPDHPRSIVTTRRGVTKLTSCPTLMDVPSGSVISILPLPTVESRTRRRDRLGTLSQSNACRFADQLHRHKH